jgi:hypothetical protein
MSRKDWRFRVDGIPSVLDCSLVCNFKQGSELLDYLPWGIHKGVEMDLEVGHFNRPSFLHTAISLEVVGRHSLGRIRAVGVVVGDGRHGGIDIPIGEDHD